MPLKTLVTGYPRGATRWAYRVLKSAGGSVGFCSVFTEEASSQYTYKAVADAPYDIEVSWFGAPFIKHPALHNVNIIRLERHPLSVASSLFWLGACRAGHNTHMEKWYRVMSRYVKGLDREYKGCPGQASLHFVCEWAERMLQLADHEDTCVKAEDGESNLLSACGVSPVSIKSIPPCNVSGCSSQFDITESKFPVYEQMRHLLVTRGYWTDEVGTFKTSNNYAG